MKIINWFKNLFKRKEEKQPDSKIVRWTDEDGVQHAKYTIYVGKLSQKEKENIVVKHLNSYKEDVKWDENIGELSINGTASIPYSKHIWFPSPDFNDGDIKLESVNEKVNKETN
jgi:hypothetical protein